MTQPVDPKKWKMHLCALTRDSRYRMYCANKTAGELRKIYATLLEEGTDSSLNEEIVFKKRELELVYSVIKGDKEGAESALADLHEHCSSCLDDIMEGSVGVFLDYINADSMIREEAYIAPPGKDESARRVGAVMKDMYDEYSAMINGM